MSGSPPPQVVSRKKLKQPSLRRCNKNQKKNKVGFPENKTKPNPIEEEKEKLLIEELGAKKIPLCITIVSPWIVVGGYGDGHTSLILSIKEEEEEEEGKPVEFFPLDTMVADVDITRCHGSGGGWLAMCRTLLPDDGQILPYLINPLSNRMIQLPPLQLDPSNYSEGSHWFLCKARGLYSNITHGLRFNILAYPNGGGFLVTAMDRKINDAHLSYCRLQGGTPDAAAAAKWVQVEVACAGRFYGSCRALSFLGGDLFAFYLDGYILRFSFDSNGVFLKRTDCELELPDKLLKEDDLANVDFYPVESEGGLLMVVANYQEPEDDEDDDVPIAEGYDVYDVIVESGEWVWGMLKLSGLGERSVFLSCYSTVCVDVSKSNLEASGFRNNCIYHTVNEEHGWCQFSLEDNKFIEGPPLIF